jgi:hypothetical protein
MECLWLWPTYVGEKGRTLGKTYGIKAWCYWEYPWGTHWELEGNMLGRKEKRKKSSPSPPPNPKLERKKIKAPWVHASAYPLAAFIFSFQNYWSPFLA